MPLRPELFRRLKEKFRHVVIANEGQEMACRYEDGELKILNAGEYYRVNCPFCTDNRKRLWINHKWGLYDDNTKSLNLWLAHCYNDYECLKRYPERRRALYNDVFDPTGSIGAVDEVDSGTWSEEPCRPAFLPGDIVPINKLPDEHEASIYLSIRGFDRDYLSKWFGVGYCTTARPELSMVAGRIFIPVYKDEFLVGWQARTVGEPLTKFTPKYYCMPGWRRGLYVYNYDLASRYNHVVICEGPTDVWRYGPEAVCLFGKLPTPAQGALLSNTWTTQFLVLDSDVPESEVTRAKGRLDPFGKARHIVITLPIGHDPGSMHQEQLRALVKVAADREGITLTTR